MATNYMIHSLEFRQGTSDKVYHVQTVDEGGGYVVNFQYGRRGAALTSGTKTPKLVSRGDAERLHLKLVDEKMAKGYTLMRPAETSPGTVGTASKEIMTDMLPQLLTEVDEANIERFITDDAYCAQEKLDGRNKALRVQDGEVTSTNKKGQPVPTPADVAAQAATAGDCICHAEHIGDVYHVHNLTQMGGKDMTNAPYTHRLAKCVNLFPWTGTPVRVVPTAMTTAEKRKLYQELKARNAEGMVFKLKSAPFRAGYTEQQFKVKFWASLSARIRTLRPGGALSIECELWDGNAWVSCGNVTVLKQGLIDTLKVRDIVEIKYLYAVRGSGQLYQPSPCMTEGTFKRDDVDDKECTTKQLKFKGEQSC